MQFDNCYLLGNHNQTIEEVKAGSGPLLSPDSNATVTGLPQLLIFVLHDVKKVHFSVTFLLITFLCAFFQNFFNGFEISVKFCVFWHIFWFFQIFFFFILVLFSNFDCKCAGNGSKKQKIFFYECILEFNYATITGFA